LQLLQAVPYDAKHPMLQLLTTVAVLEAQQKKLQKG